MKTLEQMKEELYERGLSAYFDALAPFVKQAIRITLDAQEDRDLPLGVSKFGGLPDLPDGVQWFRTRQNDIPMSFIAQVNFAQVAPFDPEHKLPEEGMLYFFYDCSPDGMPWGFNPEDSDGWKVFFYDGDLSSLSRREVPEDLNENENGMIFGSAGMCFSAGVELPSPESDLTENLNFPHDEELQDAYWEWLEEQEEEDEDDECINKLLGHADPIQSGMELECEYVTHNINCGTPGSYQTAKSMGLDRNAARWNLLMQVDSNEESDMMWGDMGRLYLWITDEDLAARNFEKCWLILQCY